MTFIASLWQAMPSTVSLGLLWGIMTLGLYLTYRLLDFADLTVDGSFALGGAVAAHLVVTGWNPFAATAMAFLAGMTAGAVTGLMHTKLKIPGLLASILTQIGLYSINLHIMGKANLPFPVKITEAGKVYTTVFGMVPSFGMGNKGVVLFYSAIAIILVIFALWWFFSTEQGITIRSTGDNEHMSRALGINTDSTKLLCLMLGNGLVGMSGAMIAQNNKVATLDMGTGCIVFGLAAIIIGEVLFRRRSLLGQLFAVALGSIVYRIIQSVVLQADWPAEDFKLLSAIIIAIALSLPVITEKVNSMMVKMGWKAAVKPLPVGHADHEAMKEIKETNVSAAVPSTSGSLVVKHVEKTFNIGTINQKTALNGVDLTLNPGDFVTIIGGNGAGKSTMLNVIAGVHKAETGIIEIGGTRVNHQAEYKRAAKIGRVFQDPMMGTAAGMTIEENMSIAMKRGKRRTLAPAIRRENREQYRQMLKTLDLGLENRLRTRVGLLSGGQRQALTLLMATLTKPDLLLLDEHTAALDPKTAKNVLTLTERIVRMQGLTAMMVTHNMRDAIRYGNRIIMMHEGRVILDIAGEEKAKLKVEDLLVMFEKASGSEMANDRMLLS